MGLRLIVTEGSGYWQFGLGNSHWVHAMWRLVDSNTGKSGDPMCILKQQSQAGFNSLPACSVCMISLVYCTCHRGAKDGGWAYSSGRPGDPPWRVAYLRALGIFEPRGWW